MKITRRPRRSRKSDVIRALLEETKLSLENFILPLFLKEGGGTKEVIPSMPNVFRHSVDSLLKEIEECILLGIKNFCLFPFIDHTLKDQFASESSNPESIYLKTIRKIKTHFPEAYLMSDVAMDPYSSDGHDGVYKDGVILNDETLPILGKMALAQAQAGTDIIGPSDMMDGRIGYIREVLDRAGFEEVLIMAYTAKYASALYEPFRDAIGSAPQKGDKKTCQMNPANRREALLEATLDIQEGADVLMVTPALCYLDVIKALKDHCHLPIAAYSTSGEYTMIKAAAHNDWLDEKEFMLESLLSIKRAGADVILSYFAKEYAKILNKPSF